MRRKTTFEAQRSLLKSGKTGYEIGKKRWFPGFTGGAKYKSPNIYRRGL